MPDASRWVVPLVAGIRCCRPCHRWLTSAMYQQQGIPVPDHPLTILAHDPRFQDGIQRVLPLLATAADTTWPTLPARELPVLVRAEVVRSWAHTAADPLLAHLLAYNLQVRWFVGRLLLEPALSPEQLRQRAIWLARTHPQVVSDLVAALPARATPSELRMAR